MIDQRTALQVRDLLLKAAKLIDASIKKESGVTCTHDHCEQLTTMSAQMRSYLCSDCGYTWNEEHHEEDVRTFKRKEEGSGDGNQIKLPLPFDS